MKPMLPLPYKPLPRRKAQYGLTILEWLVATTVMLISVAAVVAMQANTLRAHKVSDDVIVASNLASHASELLQADAIAWRGAGAQTTYFNTSTINNNAFTWNSLSSAPVNFQWSNTNDDTQAFNQSKAPHLMTSYQAKYCIYYGYRWAGSESSAVLPGTTDTFFGFGDLLEVNLAVIWPHTYEGLTTVLREQHEICNRQSGGGVNTANILALVTSNTNQTNLQRMFRQVRHSFYIRRDMTGGF